MTRAEIMKKFNAFDHGELVDNLILFNNEDGHMIVFEETSGSQLIPEDYEEGYDAYIMATVINIDPCNGNIGEIADEGEQYPFFYSTERVHDEYDLIPEWLESFYDGRIPSVTVVRI